MAHRYVRRTALGLCLLITAVIWASPARADGSSSEYIAPGAGTSVPVYDTAWQLFARANTAEADEYFATLRAYGFSGTWAGVIHHAPATYAHNYRDGGAIGALDASGNLVLSPGYVAHVRAILDEADAHGMKVGLVAAWQNLYLPGGGADAGNPTSDLVRGTVDEANAYAYGQHIVESFGDHPAVSMWVFGGDAGTNNTEANKAVWREMAAGVRDSGSTHDITYHTPTSPFDQLNYAGEPWLDFIAPETGHGQDAAETEAELLVAGATYELPVWQGEPRYFNINFNWVPLQYRNPGVVEVEADAIAALNAGVAGYVYGDAGRWHWCQNFGDSSPCDSTNVAASFGAGEQAVVAVFSQAPCAPNCGFQGADDVALNVEAQGVSGTEALSVFVDGVSSGTMLFGTATSVETVLLPAGTAWEDIVLEFSDGPNKNLTITGFTLDGDFRSMTAGDVVVSGQWDGAACSDLGPPIHNELDCTGSVQFLAPIAPVVINELRFGVDDGRAEYIELRNTADMAIDVSGWSVDRFGVLPAGSVIDAGGLFVLASDTVAYGREFPGAQPPDGLFAPSTSLSMTGEQLALADAAGHLVEEILFGVGTPWPASPAIEGGSLERVDGGVDGLLPSSWSGSALGTPGSVNGVVLCGGRVPTVDLATGGLPTGGDDVILGTPLADVVYAVGGSDIICGLGGDDQLFAGAGDDLVIAGGGDDLATGQGGVDVLFGGSGADRLNGGNHADVVVGGTGSDLLRGQGGGDILLGGGDLDEIFGGSGDDEIHTGPGGNRSTLVVVSGGGNNDVIFGGPDNDSLLGISGADVIYGRSGDDVLSGGNGADALHGDSGEDLLAGGANGDVLYGGVGDDVLNAGTGDDSLFGEDGADVLNGQGGTDVCSDGAPGQAVADALTGCEHQPANP